jgi:FtsP/CotA-like multicopper oxidase with cupredoxin domain/peroxiredoxin
MKTVLGFSVSLRRLSAAVGWSLALSSVTLAAEESKKVDLKERQRDLKATADLQAQWLARATAAKAAAAAPAATAAALTATAPKAESALPAPQRLSLARSATAGFTEPKVVRSSNGSLSVTLEAAYAHLKIGQDPVHLRTLNGQLVGPTLRAKPGDKLRITVRNVLPPERWQPNMMNTMNGFNTINMHYHGLHVSPNGISDNVLIVIGSQETQEYEVDLPADHPPGTYWYHPHRHGSTAGTVASSMSGALIIEGGLDDIPEIKAAKDRVMVLNQIPYLYKNTIKGVTYDLPEGVIEEQYASLLLGPTSWADLGRYTTINGVQLPVLRLRPGQIERWRFIDSGQGETIELKIVGAPAADGTPSTASIPFYEIAADGLALGKVVKTSMVELWPGYRSDVLVQAPTTPGEYFLIDDAVEAGNSISGGAEPLNYVARIVVEGAPMTMKLPTDAQVASLRLPSIKTSEITGKQEATYGINIVGGKVVFTIDGKSFEMETARQLKLNDVDEWTIYSKNDVGPVTHPFHIHVNPFEVTSIMAPDPKDPTKLVEQLTNGPIWRDTVKIPGNGYVKMRTKYTDFIGTFVQHCHILDHEDQGMMELIDIVDKTTQTASTSPTLLRGSPVPGFSLPDVNGKLHALQDTQGKPTVVFFFKGYGCSHCALQVAAFAEHYAEFARRGIQVVGVTSDSVEALRADPDRSPLPFALLADPDGKAFAKFGCVDTAGLRHGTFALNAEGQLLWSTLGASPYLTVKDLFKVIEPAASTPAPAAAAAANTAKKYSVNP